MAKTVNNVKVNTTFTTATAREQLTSGENLCTSLGKINKYLADLDAGAFTFPANGGNADTLDGKHASDFTLSYIRNNKPLVTSILALETVARLTWLPVDGATKYAVALYIGGEYVQQSTSITNTYYDIQNLTPGTVYLALVQAYVNNAWSKFNTDDLVHFYTLPVASATTDGLVTTGSQTFAGLKTFNNGIRSNVEVPIYISGSLKYPKAIHTNSGSADKDGFIIFGDSIAELQVNGTNIWRQATSLSNRPELRNLASGTTSADTNNCPSGAWYGKHA